MAIIQISKVQVRTGNSAELPQLSPGEFGYATDNNTLFIGNDPVIGVNPTPDNTEILTEFSNIPAAGNNGQLQFNNAGITSGDANIEYDTTTGVLTVLNEVITGNVTLPANITVNTLPSSATDTTIILKLPITLSDGNTYYICLTQNQ